MCIRDRVNAELEYVVDDAAGWFKPAADEDRHYRERFIRAKYVERTFALPSPRPARARPGGDGGSADSVAATAAPVGGRSANLLSGMVEFVG